MFYWKDEYSVGIDEIDNQHKRIFEIGNNIIELAELKDDYDHYDEIMQIMYELKDYTVYHFGFEEEMLESINYDELESHKIIHYFFVKKLEKQIKSDIDADQNQTAIDLANFVADWIASHILSIDKKYSVLFKGDGTTNLK